MSKRKLLLADDSITIQKVVNLTFADEDFEVISVGDGNSAMDKLREDSPDLVLADVNMPGLNGYEICEKIKAADQNLPVILLVGSFEPFDEDEAKRVGADDYLTKPFQSISQLVSKVNGLLNSVKQDSADGGNFAVSENQQFDGFDDSNIDDEMMQTDQIGSMPINEITKFETQANENEGLTAFAQTSEEYESADDYQFNQEISEKKQDFINTQEFEAESESEKIDGGETTDFPMPEAASVLELDEMNLLELPPLDIPEDKSSDTDKTEMFEEINLNQSSTEQTASDSTDDEIISPYSTTKTIEMPEHLNENSEDQADFDDSEDQEIFDENVSPEMVEAIAQKVIKRLSDKIIKEIAWEVVPQMADMIIKKMAEEKMK